MTFSAIDQISRCETVDELSHVWKSNVDQWSQLPNGEAKVLIRIKNTRKAELSKAWAENGKGYPIPTTEKEFAQDERQAIIDVDGGPDYPVEVVMESAILGTPVDVILEPDQATVDGVVYSNAELLDLKSRGLSADDLWEVHEMKGAFGGGVIPSDQAAKIESHTISR